MVFFDAFSVRYFPFQYLKEKPGSIQMSNNLCRARHSVRAAGWQSTHSAGRGLPALSVYSTLFVTWIIPEKTSKPLLTMKKA
jgi:hypothetical protein